MTRIDQTSHVTLHYRMALLVDGAERELVNTFGSAPATLQMGVGQWAPTLEQHLVGLEEGQSLDVALPAEQAYGAHHPELVRTLSQEQLAQHCGPDQRLAPGENVELRGGAQPVRGVIAACDAGAALVDFNHPLAGLPMRLRVQVIGVL